MWVNFRSNNEFSQTQPFSWFLCVQIYPASYLSKYPQSGEEWQSKAETGVGLRSYEWWDGLITIEIFTLWHVGGTP